VQVCQFHDETMKKSPYPDHVPSDIHVKIPMLPSPKLFVIVNDIAKSVATRCKIYVHEPTSDGFFVNYDHVLSIFSCFFCGFLSSHA
jgi:hypothetical protein